ncbi:MAG: NfeD family protein [Rudaea sp.]|uniref:NfeD family protein n=1 Tax=unclassified Rudaea TaxID=2627037 RepID=UPI0010FA2E71|nr:MULTISPECIES: NfeD family protein [unclassified Rudaea]MBN8887322.1 NfeD family protein [Rudaea sp.]MBR0344005.1 NfeD family protein [Rudaea sp.]
MHYGWWILAFVLIGAELLAPGYFLIWIGFAAAALGAVTFFTPELSLLVQAVLFAVLALISCFIYWRFVRKVVNESSDRPLLNRRAEQFIGQRYTLETAIVGGKGKVRIGDSPWLAEGPDLPAGAEVEVVGVDGTTVKVHAVRQ